jgi:hypothetical protein
LWVIQIQCLTQIMANRISLILYDNEKARRVKLGVAMCIGLVNITVFIIWVPARLQINPTWIHINNVWDRCEKCIFLIVDVWLNIYFMRLVKSKLIAEGLDRYKQVYRFNVALVFISISLDVSAAMVLPSGGTCADFAGRCYWNDVASGRCRVSTNTRAGRGRRA